MAGYPAPRTRKNVEIKEVSRDYILGDTGCHVEDLGFLLESRVLSWGVLRSDLSLKRFFLLPCGDWVEGRSRLELMESVGSH